MAEPLDFGPLDQASGYSTAISQAESANGIPAGLLRQQLMVESNLNPNAYNASSGATGIAQILPSTAADPGYGLEPHTTLGEPTSDIAFAGRYLRALYSQTGSWTQAIQRYGTIGTEGPQNPPQSELWSMAGSFDRGLAQRGGLDFGPLYRATGFTPTPEKPAAAPETGGDVGFFPGLWRGLQHIAGQKAPNDRLQALLDKPLGWDTALNPSWWTSQLGNLVGLQGPTVGLSMAGAAAGEAVAPEAGPIGPLVGAGAGAFVGNEFSTMLPNYNEAVAKGMSHDNAMREALKKSTIESTILAPMAAIPALRPMARIIENKILAAFADALVNIGATQPLIGAAGQTAVTLATEGRLPTAAELGQGYVQNVITGAGLTAPFAARDIRAAIPAERARRLEQAAQEAAAGFADWQAGGKQREAQQAAAAEAIDRFYGRQPRALPSPAEEPMPAPTAAIEAETLPPRPTPEEWRTAQAARQAAREAAVQPPQPAAAPTVAPAAAARPRPPTIINQASLLADHTGPQGFDMPAAAEATQGRVQDALDQGLPVRMIVNRVVHNIAAVSPRPGVLIASDGRPLGVAHLTADTRNRLEIGAEPMPRVGTEIPAELPPREPTPQQMPPLPNPFTLHDVPSGPNGETRQLPDFEIEIRKNGKSKGTATGYIDGDTVHIDDLDIAPQWGRYSLASVRNLLAAIREKFPQATQVQGFRITGAKRRAAGIAAEEDPRTLQSIRLPGAGERSRVEDVLGNNQVIGAGEMADAGQLADGVHEVTNEVGSRMEPGSIEDRRPLLAGRDYTIPPGGGGGRRAPPPPPPPGGGGGGGGRRGAPPPGGGGGGRGEEPPPPPPPGGGGRGGGGDGGRNALMSSAGRFDRDVRAAPNYPLSIQRLTAVQRYTMMAAGIAARDEFAANLLAALDDHQAARHRILYHNEERLKDFFATPDAQLERVYKALEYMRMTGTDLLERGRAVYAGRPGTPGAPPTSIGVRVDPRAFPDTARWPLQLTRPGEEFTLTPWDIDHLRVIRDTLRTNWLQGAVDMAYRFGYRDPNIIYYDTQGRPQIDLDRVRQVYETAGDPVAKKAAERALEILSNAVFNQRGMTYFPLYREGDWEIRVTPKVPITGTGHPTPHETWVFHEPALNPLDIINRVRTLYGNKPPPRVQTRINQIRAQFPERDYNVDAQIIRPRTPQVIHPVLAAVDALLSDPTLINPETGERFSEAVMEKVYQKLKASFLQPSMDYPGYSTDFKKALYNYVRQAANRTANALHRDKIENAYLDTQTHPDARFRDYFQKYMIHQNDRAERSIYGLARTAGFFKYLWANPSTAIIQLLHTPISTGTQLGSVIGGIRGQRLANHSLGLAMRGIRSTADRGFYVDINAIPGLSPLERQHMEEAQIHGVFEPRTAHYMRGATDNGIAPRVLRTPVGLVAGRIWNWGGSMLSAVDQANRIAAWIAYHRAAYLPGAAEMFNKAYARDAMFQRMVAPVAPIRVGEEMPAAVRINPAKLARWGVNETNFMSQKMGAAPIQRGPGSVFFQFQHVTSNYLRLIYKNFTRMGPQGLAAGTMMLGGLLLTSGLKGMPFLGDMLRVGDGIGKTIFGIDPRLDDRFRELMADNAWAHFFDDLWGWQRGTTGETLAEGPSRLFGIDIGRRVGLGALLPSDPSLFQAIPALAATVGAFEEAWHRWNAGQGIPAALAALPYVPAPISNLIKAYLQWPQQGVVGQTGTTYLMPSQITPGMQAAQALGFRPAAVARAQEKLSAKIATEMAPRQEANRQLKIIATQYALAQDAFKHGDDAGAQNHLGQAHDLIARYNEEVMDPSLEAYQRMPRLVARAIKMRAFSIANPNMLSRAMIRRGMGTYQSPYVSP